MTQTNSNRDNKGISIIFGQEIAKLTQNKSWLILFIIYPIMIGLFFLFMFYPGRLTHLPVAIVDQDNSISSHQIIRQINSSSEISINNYYKNITTAKAAMMDGKHYAIIAIPPLFEHQVNSNANPQITTYYNNQFMTIGHVIATKVDDLIAQAARDKKFTLQSQNDSDSVIYIQSQLNPTPNFLFNFINGIYPAIMQIIIVLSAIITFNAEKIFHYNDAKSTNVFSLLVGKLLPYIIGYTVILSLFDFAFFRYLSLKINAGFIFLLFNNLLFVINSLCFGAIIILIFSNIISGCLVCSLLTMPIFGFIGITLPLNMMGSFSQLWGHILPITYYLNIKFSLLSQFSSNDFTVSLLYLIITAILLSLLIKIKLIPILNKKVGQLKIRITIQQNNKKNSNNVVSGHEITT